MAIQKARLYSLEDNFISLNGVRLQEWGPDAGIEYTQRSDIAEQEDGATGTANISKIHNKNMEATITVMQTGRDYKVISALIRAQEDATGIPPVSLVHIDKINGDKLVCTGLVFKNRGDVTYNKTAGTVTFEVFLPYAAETNLRGTNIS